MMTDLADKRQALLNRIQQAVTATGRTVDQTDGQAGGQAGGQAEATVMLLAVSKTRSSDDIRALYEVGQLAFGENYLQEALAKQEQLGDLPLIWHFIGHVQRNKTRDLAAHFDWIHGVDRLLIAQRLSQQRPDHRPPLNLCLQVNIDQQDSKDGCHPDEVAGLVAAISQLPGLRLRGLMVIPDPARPVMDAFRRTRQLFEQTKVCHARPADWDTLSMGMSDDLEQAITAGSTLVRVGTALFGARPARMTDPAPLNS